MNIRRRRLTVLPLAVAVLSAAQLVASPVVASQAAGAQERPVRPGISVLMTDSVHLVRGKRVALLTNQSGMDEHGISDIDRLVDGTARSAGVKLVALFAPEHGIRGTEDRTNIAGGVDAKSGAFNRQH